MTPNIAFRPEGGALIVYLSGEIDHHAASFLRMQIDQQIGMNQPERLILDFHRVGLMDSSGIGLILGRYHRMRESGGSLELRGLSHQLETTVRLAGLTSDIHIRGEEE